MVRERSGSGGGGENGEFAVICFWAWGDVVSKVL